MKQLIMALAVCFLIGCAAIALRPGAELVRVTNTEPGRECQFLGDVTGSQGNRYSGRYTSNENLETGARNDLKNKAAALGGNVVYLISQRAGQTGRYNRDSGSSQQTNVTLSGSVYRCPE